MATHISKKRKVNKLSVLSSVHLIVASDNNGRKICKTSFFIDLLCGLMQIMRAYFQDAA